MTVINAAQNKTIAKLIRSQPPQPHPPLPNHIIVFRPSPEQSNPNHLPGCPRHADSV
ncbi:hypothetical protein [Mycolicibacterium fluoranthenivorans]|uniref:Uncharacterized protein n=1 Tax=Mycolicibacterium fluoranthenivorans TaxID=258505 RepID=A0A7X5U4J9_9MYCO|nr:hypothetical protein [Mycolicibacterium fluoranthenivorans]MCV7355377.1 hypothetical protein [Mycolicibacterium fluoranthenivorans]NIH98315.1 hypothetical protein [Mycolicibacterium fluoranthenivorans]